MGRVIQFPLARAQQRRRPTAALVAFADFGELDLLERAQLRLFAGCTAGAVLLTIAFQILALAAAG